eukprot:scaffold2178_cov363-Pavlova_lutheri.AAC.1
MDKAHSESGVTRLDPFGASLGGWLLILRILHALLRSEVAQWQDRPSPLCVATLLAGDSDLLFKELLSNQASERSNGISSKTPFLVNKVNMKHAKSPRYRRCGKIFLWPLHRICRTILFVDADYCIRQWPPPVNEARLGPYGTLAYGSEPIGLPTE